MTARQQRFIIRVFLLPNGLPSWVVEVYVPKAVGYEVTFFRFHVFTDFELNLVVRGYLKCMPGKHFIGCENLSPI